MKSRTYYEILGVSRDASIEEITIAKNALAKVEMWCINKEFMVKEFEQELQRKHALSHPHFLFELHP